MTMMSEREKLARLLDPLAFHADGDTWGAARQACALSRADRVLAAGWRPATQHHGQPIAPDGDAALAERMVAAVAAYNAARDEAMAAWMAATEAGLDVEIMGRYGAINPPTRQDSGEGWQLTRIARVSSLLPAAVRP